MSAYTEGMLAKKITDKEVISAFVVEVIDCDLLPAAIGDVFGQHGLCIDVRPVNCLSGLGLYIFPSPCVHHIGQKGPFEESGGT